MRETQGPAGLKFDPRAFILLPTPWRPGAGHQRNSPYPLLGTKPLSGSKMKRKEGAFVVAQAAIFVVVIALVCLPLYSSTPGGVRQP
jgi:hypothetical protein